MYQLIKWAGRWIGTSYKIFRFTANQRGHILFLVARPLVPQFFRQLARPQEGIFLLYLPPCSKGCVPQQAKVCDGSSLWWDGKMGEEGRRQTYKILSLLLGSPSLPHSQAISYWCMVIRKEVEMFDLHLSSFCVFLSCLRTQEEGSRFPKVIV